MATWPEPNAPAACAGTVVPAAIVVPPVYVLAWNSASVGVVVPPKFEVTTTPLAVAEASAIVPLKTLCPVVTVKVVFSESAALPSTRLPWPLRVVTDAAGCRRFAVAAEAATLSGPAPIELFFSTVKVPPATVVPDPAAVSVLTPASVSVLLPVLLRVAATPPSLSTPSSVRLFVRTAAEVHRARQIQAWSSRSGSRRWPVRCCRCPT